MIPFKSLVDAANSAGLVEAARDACIYFDTCERSPRGPALMQQHQLAFFRKPVRAGRIARIIPNPMLVAVCVKNDRALSIGGLKAIGIQFCLC